MGELSSEAMTPLFVKKNREDIQMKQTAMKFLGVVAIAMMLAPAVSRAQQPLVVDTPFVHDPVMAFENGKYYLYCTGHGITQMTSPIASIGL